jgi:hypothetical protein
MRINVAGFTNYMTSLGCQTPAEIARYLRTDRSAISRLNDNERATADLIGRLWLYAPNQTWRRFIKPVEVSDDDTV